MYTFQNICFVCLTDNAKDLTVVYNTEILTHVKYVLPEIETLDFQVPPNICTSCSITLSFFNTFKTKCLKNYNRWKHYIQTLQGTSDTQAQTFRELQIKLVNCESMINQKHELDIERHINIKNEDQTLLSSESEEEIFNDSEIKIYDNKPVIKQEPDVHIISDIDDTNETTLEDSNTITGLDAEEETVASEVNADQEFIQQPEFVIVKCEPILDDEQNGDSSVTSMDNDEPNSINDTGSQEFKLKDHIKTHRTKNFACTICNKMFSKRISLNQHIKTHSDVKKFECTVCNKTYSSRSNLAKHQNKHLEPELAKKYECTVCNKKFYESGTLKVHMKVHLNIRNFECTVCKKKFITNSELKVHMNYHLGKRFQCPVCKKRFYTNNSMKNHFRKHNVE